MDGTGTVVICPDCGAVVKQVASATLGLALWQHQNWVCKGDRPVINIWSGTKGVIGALTNPTELAKKKGSIKNSYPLEVDGIKYKDAEEVYQHMKKYFPDDMDYLLGTMIAILLRKFEKYPTLVTAIRTKGGLKWLSEKCEHRVNGGRWEGKGRESWFLVAMMAAYSTTVANDHIQKLTSEQLAKVKGFDV